MKNDIKIVIFVSSGYQDPYASLERGMIKCLQACVEEVYVVAPNQDVAKIASKLQAEFVLVFSGFALPAYQVQELRRNNIKTAVWLTDDPYFIDESKLIVSHYDFVFTQESNCVPIYQAMGCTNAYYLPLAVDDTIFYPQRVEKEYEADILFIGVAFANRIACFDAIAPYLASKRTVISGVGWQGLKQYALLRQHIKPNQWLSATETARYYNGAKIVINLHRAHDDVIVNRNKENIEAHSPNPRTFEIAACEAFQLTDIRPDLLTFYQPGHEIETYETNEELVGKIEYYLHHDDERIAIAERAGQLVRKYHTCTKRLETILKHVKGDLR